jgi:hypothetical protein
MIKKAGPAFTRGRGREKLADLLSLSQVILQSTGAGSRPYKYISSRKDGTTISVLERGTPIEYEGGRAVLGSFMDFMEQNGS